METLLLILKIVGLIVGTVATIGSALKDSKATREKRWALGLAGLGFGVAVLAEIVDASQKQKSAIEATERNNALLAEVQRNLHPLFPLRVDVAFRAPLRGDETRSFRAALEKKYLREHSHDPRRPVIFLWPEEPEYPKTCKQDPVGVQIVNAHLGSMVRIYNRQRTKSAHFEKPDIEFCTCPTWEDQDPRAAVVTGDQERRSMIAHREFTFKPDTGLYVRIRGRKIDFVDAKATTDVMSADDLLGATLEIETQSVLPEDVDEYKEAHCQPVVPTNSEMISFAGVAIVLPGWRRLVIEGALFSRIGSPDDADSIIYRFSFPEDKEGFNKLARSERVSVIDEAP